MAPLNRLTFFARAARARAVAGRRVFNQAPRRHYASEGGHAAPGSDIPWMAGSAAITIGGMYLLWPPSNGGHGGDHGHGDSHGAAKEEESKEEDKEEASKGDDSGDDKQEDEKGDGEDKKEDKEDDSKDDSKGDSKDEGGDDKRTAYEKYDGKPKAGRENTSSKEGPDNTLARHASSPHSHAEKSKKSEGTVDTARVKGTIDPKREQK